MLRAPGAAGEALVTPGEGSTAKGSPSCSSGDAEVSALDMGEEGLVETLVAHPAVEIDKDAAG
ncbi:hypothetical protein CTI14_41945, partial [Methylobacterium radiotolerans]